MHVSLIVPLLLFAAHGIMSSKPTPSPDGFLIGKIIAEKIKASPHRKHQTVVDILKDDELILKPRLEPEDTTEDTEDEDQETEDSSEETSLERREEAPNDETDYEYPQDESSLEDAIYYDSLEERSGTFTDDDQDLEAVRQFLDKEVCRMTTAIQGEVASKNVCGSWCDKETDDKYTQSICTLVCGWYVDDPSYFHGLQRLYCTKQAEKRS